MILNKTPEFLKILLHDKTNIIRMGKILYKVLNVYLNDFLDIDDT